MENRRTGRIRKDHREDHREEQTGNIGISNREEQGKIMGKISNREE